MLSKHGVCVRIALSQPYGIIAVMIPTHKPFNPSGKAFALSGPCARPVAGHASIGGDRVTFGAQELGPSPGPSEPSASQQDALPAAAPIKEGLVHQVKRGGGRILGWFQSLGSAIWSPVQRAGAFILSPFKQIRDFKLITRLKNGVDNAIGYPRHQKVMKAGIWAGATFLIGCIPVPGFQALIAAAPVTFLTTLLVDIMVGFWDGVSKDPDKMKAFLAHWREQAGSPA